MKANNRNLEKEYFKAVKMMIKKEGLKLNQIVDLKSVGKGHCLEGLGSVIHDHINKIIYMTKIIPFISDKYFDRIFYLGHKICQKTILVS